MYDLESVVNMLDFTLSTEQKRHIVGGILLSISLLFGGLALTTMTIKPEKRKKSEEAVDDYE